MNLDVISSSYSDTHSLWSAMGAKYQPSIIYKLRNIIVNINRIKTIETKLTDVKSMVVAD